MRFHHPLLVIAFWLFAGFVVWGQLTPGDPIVNGYDKLQHMTAYAVLAGLATLALDAKGRWLWALAGLILFGAVMELIQGAVGRDMSLKDEIANILGVTAGGTAGWALCALRARLVDRQVRE